MPADMNFADPFPPADEAQWRTLVARVLKDAPFERLVSRTADGIAIEPLYFGAKREPPRALRASAGNWAIAARLDHPDPAEANRLALADLAGGANALQIVCAGATGAFGFGLPATREALEAALAGVQPDAGLHIEVDAGSGADVCAVAVADLVGASSLAPESASVCFGLDPLSPTMAATARALATRGFTGRFCVADARAINAAGGTPAQELAYALAAALAGWRALEKAGFEIGAARGMLSFRIAADADQFLTIARLRALRRLWARVEESAGLAPRPIHIHAETAWRMMTRRDPAVNLLRGTISALSAGLGGADVVSVLPWTQALGLPDAQARRLARNTQLILLEECNLGRVADPAGGAGVYEAMTEALCEKAWALMQDVERAGGLAAALASGAFQAQVAAARAGRQRSIATRRAPLTGVSEFADLAEAPVAVLAPLAPASADEGPFAAHRDAEDFERLRDLADARAAGARRPSVFLTNLGAHAAYAAREAFARNLFEAGGVRALTNDGFDDDAALAAAFQASGARLACLCSSDAVYEERAAAVARSLVAAGARRVWLAGRGGATQATLQQAGVSGFVFAGCDAIAVLEEALAHG